MKNFKQILAVFFSVLLIAFLGLLVIYVVASWRGRAVGRSGESFPIGDSQVIVDFGYADGGSRLRYAVIRVFSADTPTEKKLHDPRIHDDYSDAGPFVRGKDGRMVRVETDGAVYLLDGDNVRKMKVNMSEDEDTVGLHHCRSTEEVWAFFKRFEVPAANSQRK